MKSEFSLEKNVLVISFKCYNIEKSTLFNLLIYLYTSFSDRYGGELYLIILWQKINVWRTRQLDIFNHLASWSLRLIFVIDGCQRLILSRNY